MTVLFLLLSCPVFLHLGLPCRSWGCAPMLCWELPVVFHRTLVMSSSVVVFVGALHWVILSFLPLQLILTVNILEDAYRQYSWNCWLPCLVNLCSAVRQDHHSYSRVVTWIVFMYGLDNLSVWKSSQLSQFTKSCSKATWVTFPATYPVRTFQVPSRVVAFGKKPSRHTGLHVAFIPARIILHPQEVSHRIELVVVSSVAEVSVEGILFHR